MVFPIVEVNTETRTKLHKEEENQPTEPQKLFMSSIYVMLYPNCIKGSTAKRHLVFLHLHSYFICILDMLSFRYKGMEVTGLFLS